MSLFKLKACGHSRPSSRCQVCRQDKAPSLSETELEWVNQELAKAPKPTAEKLARVKQILQSA